MSNGRVSILEAGIGVGNRDWRPDETEDFSDCGGFHVGARRTGVWTYC